MNKKIVFLTGGTGGHVIPAITFANFLIEKGYECHLILDKRGKKYSNKFKGKEYIIYSSHLSGNILHKFKSLINLFVGFVQSIILITKLKPKNCISFGSYATFMPLIVILFFKFFLKTNIYIHEQNSVIGKVNLFFLPYAVNLFTNFEFPKNLKKIYLDKKMYVGMPTNKKDNFNKLKDDEIKQKKIIFIYGGSQGSLQLINNIMLMLNKVDFTSIKNIKFIVQAPKIIISSLKKSMEDLKLEYEIKEFYNNIDEVLNMSVIAITRAGAGTISDLVRYCIPSIIVPLTKSIYNHQLYNAKFLTDKNAAILMDENNFDIDNNANILESFIKDHKKQEIMKGILKNIKLTDANQIMSTQIFR